ncbi:MAG: PorT family protein [Bacteroidetes bacterium]|nr:PorT family protein [Bacteroidota bacterium]
MKRIALLLLILPSIMLAQTPAKPFDFGAKVGINVNTLSTSLPDYTGEYYTGFGIGVFGRINVEKFYVQPELMYSAVGGDFTFDGVAYQARHQGLMMPVLFGYKFVDFKLMNIRAYAGPYFFYQFGNRVDAVGQGLTAIDMEGNLNEMGAGIQAGAGLDIWKLTFDLRYHWGLSNNLGSRQFNGEPNAGLKNANWEVSVGFKLF